MEGIILLIGALVVAFAIRVLYVIYRSRKPLGKASAPRSTLIVLGSGGHTAEMLNLLAILQIDRFFPRFYIAASTDNMSLQKAQKYEEEITSNQVMEEEYESMVCNYVTVYGTSVTNFFNVISGLASAFTQLPLTVGRKEETAKFMQIYRSREVGQSYITSIWTTLVAIAHALWLMIKLRPEVIICNGPGTCIPLCAIAFIFKMLGIRWSSVFYVESIAREKKLSLSGLLLYKLYIADQFFVQWPRLKTKYPHAHYVGRLM